MKLIQLVYKSRATPGLKESDVLNILDVSQSRNLFRRISGLLLFRDGHFIQLLEGPEEEVMAMFQHISQDRRHTDVSLLWSGRTEKASMPTWAMAYVLPPTEESARGNHSFILSKEDAVQICEALPERLGAPFREVLRLEHEGATA